MEKQLHVITTGRQNDDVLVKIAANIHPYITMLHVREKTKSAKEVSHLIEHLQKAGVPSSKIIVNDRVDVALCLGVNGVQLAHHSLNVSQVRRALPEMIIGCSVHSFSEAQNAEHHGADFIIYGHIFKTASKRDAEPRGVDQLQRVVDQTTIPVIAIGGITPENVRNVIETGATGIAVMSGILEAKSPLQAVKLYKQQLEVWDAQNV
ncbi:thiamine phosphate synthase [Fictibacillus phosphorivorans]|uniref:Thiamine-phosphate synthase n=1 Tax=Fictibacillus phosphorivorans TaxID=1221500 RepID=A0A160IQZ2_9BACL|nr:thiazole tautomerase TenI [Fictibacillus phosphorivorans]ANC78918.1 thiamine phosphate synthase [Fictibacillus phosphorivorans]